MFARLAENVAKTRTEWMARAKRNERQAARLCIWAVAASFALCSLLQLYFGQVRANRQFYAAEAARARDIAASVDATLTRLQSTGLLFANGGLAEEAVVALPGMRGIAISDKAGLSLRHSGEAIDMAALTALVHRDRTVVGAGKTALIAFRDVDRMIAVSFEPSAIAPAAYLKTAAVVGPTGVVLAGTSTVGRTVTAAAPGWPVTVRIAIDANDRPSVWNGLLPLYLFAIFGPLLAAWWLTRTVEAELNWRAKVAKLIRALRISHPRGPKLQLRLSAAERRSAETIRAQSALFAKVVREIADPLTAVTGFSEIIEKGLFGPPPEKYGAYARDIGQAGKSIAAKLNQILELSSIQGGAFAPKPGVCDGTELTAAVIGENAGRAFLRRIWLEMPPSPPVAIVADAQAVKRILRDLIANALSRTPKGGRIRLHVQTDVSDAIFLVEDTGRPYDRPPTVRTKAVRRASADSPANLDLAIVAELARAMGGSLTFTQASGAGCQAALRLPLAPERDPQPLPLPPNRTDR